MHISGFIKTSLLDYPGKIASVIFTQGCNFRCPYCHNRQLWQCTAGTIPQEDILHYIEHNRELLDGVVITGGEPTIQSDLRSFIIKIKLMDLSVKLDTNGSHLELLRVLIRERLIDYVAMDIKSELLPQPYSKATGIKMDSASLQAIRTSVRSIIKSGIAHEFRTTMCREYVTAEHIDSIAPILYGCKAYYLQLCDETNFQSILQIFKEYSLEELKSIERNIVIPFLHVRT